MDTNKINMPPTKDQPSLLHAPSALQSGYQSCLVCGNLMPLSQKTCEICRGSVQPRKPQSLNRTTAYLLASMLLFLPANLLPIMKSTTIGTEQKDTILSGILHLWHSGSYPIAIIVFVASIVTPLFKMLSIAYLCYTCHRKSTKQIQFRTKLYHFTEIIGRWSMIDVFVVALLGALVKMGALATIEPQWGIVAFTAVVFLTMFSMAHFDPRLIWDNGLQGNPKEQANKDKQN